MSATNNKLDVTGTTYEQKCTILKYATETRRFEIERFWQRSLFFWGFVGASFVAYAAVYEKSAMITLIVACFGAIGSLAWTLQNRGSKYWQEAWEDKICIVEKDALGAHLFSNIEPIRGYHLWGPLRYSVSKLAIALSDFTCLVWITLIVKFFMPHISCLYEIVPYAIVAITILYAVLLLVFGKSGAARAI